MLTNRRKTVLAVIIVVFALSAFIAVAGSATEMSDILTVAFNLIKSIGSTASNVLSVGFSLIKTAGSSITAGLSVGFSLVKGAISTASSTVVVGFSLIKGAISSATTTLSVGFSLIKSGISSALTTVSVGFTLVKEAIISAFATITASFRLSSTPSAIFDYFEPCSHPDCEYNATEKIYIARNRVKNVGDFTSKIYIKFEELDANGNPLPGGVNCSGYIDDVPAGGYVGLYYFEYSIGGCEVEELEPTQTERIGLNPRHGGTYYFGIKTWIDGESEPSYPVPDSANQPANAKAWSVSVPTINFKVSASCNCPVYINQTAEFSANISGVDATPPYTYNWDFGDGESATGKNVTHVYPPYWRSWYATVTVIDSAGHTAKDTVKCCVLRIKTNDTIASIDDSPYYTLISALTGYEGAINESAVPDFFNFAEATVTPYTNIIGNLFFVIFFGVFFLMLWLRQENIMIPSVIGIIVGGALLGFAPAEFHLPAILFVSFSIFGVIYSMLKERS